MQSSEVGILGVIGPKLWPPPNIEGGVSFYREVMKGKMETNTAFRV